MSQEQMSFKEGGFQIDTAFIIANKEIVTDFFGDNRHWYEKLLGGGSKYRKTSLDARDENANPEEGDVYLDEKNITEGRAESISKFFEEWKEAKDDFDMYLKHVVHEKENE